MPHNLKPTHYTVQQGGKWLPWTGIESARSSSRLTAVRFSDNSVFDLIIGTWRPWVDPQEEMREALIAEIITELQSRRCTIYRGPPEGDSNDVGRFIDCTADSLKHVLRLVLAKKTIASKEST